MTAYLATTINDTNFQNPSAEERELYMDYLKQWELKADSMPPERIVAYLANAVHALRDKVCFERFGIGSDDEELECVSMAVDTAIAIEEVACDEALDGHREPIEEQMLSLILESTAIGPRSTHIKIWEQFMLNSWSHFHQYLKNLPVGTWRDILKHFRKDFQPVEGEDSRDFQNGLQQGFGDIVNNLKESPHLSLLKADLANLHLFLVTNKIGKNQEIENAMENLSTKINELLDRTPYEECNAEFYRSAMSTYVAVLSNNTQSDKCVDEVKSQIKYLVKTMKKKNLFEELYLDTLDFIKKICFKRTGSEAHSIVYEMANYWDRIKTDSIRDKNGAFLSVASTFAEFLENLEDGSYLQNNLLQLVLSDFLTKITKNTKEHHNLWIRLLTAAIQFDGDKCNYAIYATVRGLAESSKLKWKDYKKECKFILEKICRKRIDKPAGSREARDEGGRLNDLFERFLEELSKAKIITLYVDIIANHVLNIIEERAIPMFQCVQTGARSLKDVITIKEHRAVIFNSFVRLTDILKIEDYPWTIEDSQSGLSELGKYCMKGLGTGKDVTASEMKILIDITTAVLEGDFVDPDENSLGGVFYDLFLEIGSILKLLADKDELRKNPQIIKLFLKTLSHDEDDICERGDMIFNDIGVTSAPALAPYIGVILEAFLDKQQFHLLCHLPAIYNENPEPMNDYFQKLIDLIEDVDNSIVTNFYMLLTAVAKKQPMLFTEANVETIVNIMYSGDPYRKLGITTLEPLASKRSALFLKHVDKFITKPFNDDYYYFLFKILGYVAARNDEKVAEKILKYFMEFTKTNSDNTNELYLIREIKGIAFKHKDLVNKHKSFVENLRKNTSEVQVKDECDAIIDFLQGRSLDACKDELSAQQEEIDLKEEWSGPKFDETKEKQKTKVTPESNKTTTKSTHLENSKTDLTLDQSNKDVTIPKQTSSCYVKSATPKVKRFDPLPAPIQSEVEHENSMPTSSPSTTDTQQAPTPQPEQHYNDQANGVSNQDKFNSAKSKSCVIL